MPPSNSCKAGIQEKGEAISKAGDLSNQVVQILVVEDFAAYRDFVTSLLKGKTNLSVICEVADGLEAVEKAQELKPNLILLDIGLPRLNGIEVARRILKSIPESKIIFLTQENSADLVHEALDSGASGYVLKSQAGSELLAAIEAVLQGRRFISSGWDGHGSA